MKGQKAERNLKFYTFNQNNSGGNFDNDESTGQYVIIEAHCADEANDIAEQKGLYFDGVDSGIDCDCCGDRWHTVDEHSGCIVPSIYGSPIVFDSNTMAHGIVIHTYNGERYKIGRN